MSTATTAIQQTAIDTIRTLSMDAVQTANSGHPGTPMALAPVTYQLWAHQMRYDPKRPWWPNRDRYVLSCGHASMLLYSILHLAQVREDSESDELAITIDDIKKFRQVDSPCAGHPEYGDAAGIETTTGPLGQGGANAVGMAMASKWLAARYNTKQHKLFDYNVYALVSDGDLMEGVNAEAASIAGHLKLDNLCWIYDDNKITIEGDTELSFSEDVGKRFEGLGWNVARVDDANDLQQISAALQNFDQCNDRPTLVVLRSVIAWGSPNKAGTHGAHGSPLGWDEIAATKEFYGWDPDKKFHVPSEVTEHFGATCGQRGAEASAEWREKFAAYEKSEPEKAAQLKQIFARELPEGWDADIPSFGTDTKGVASRKSSGKVLNAIAKNIPWMIGGAADLAPSTNTLLEFDGAGHFSANDYAGRNLHFGIREHAMAAICNGLSLSGLRSYGATFFVFTDYMRPAMRLSSVMHQPTLFVLTHDSIGLGEDGPTHQPIEHLAACRGIPGLNVFRPGDANEVAECYRTAIGIQDHPAAMVLTRQDIPTFDRSKYKSAAGCRRGGYVLADCDGTPEVILMGSGSELHICVEAYEQLTADGVKARVVSMPCLDLFEQQDAAYQEEVLPRSVTRRVAVEAGIRQPWDRYLGFEGKFVGMSSFGASGPYEVLFKQFGITPENVAKVAKG